MRKILDKMFENKKSAMIIPLISAVVVYLLFVLFGTAEDKTNTIIMTPIVSAIWFFGVFFIIYIQVKNASCPEWFINLFEMLATILSGIYAIISVVSFFISGFQNYNFGLCPGLVTYSAVSWVHSKREKN